MSKKYVYMFSEGNASMKNLLGGKGANLAEMTNLGLPVPHGFTISTEACTEYNEGGKKLTDEMIEQIDVALGKLEELAGKKLGDPENPLLVSVRSGARASMPGMMDTILNLGLNEEVVEVMAKKSGNARWAYDCYRRFIQMYSDVVMEVGKKYFEELIDKMKEEKGVTYDVELTAEDLKELANQFKAEYKAKIGSDFPSDPKEQLLGAVKAVFRSWDNPRANVYRRDNDIPYSWGTAVNVQAMAFGNMGDNCGTGVAFTRDPATGEKKLMGEFLTNAQGEDVVAGVRTPMPIAQMEEKFPEAFAQFVNVCSGVVPGTENCFDSGLELNNGIGGEVLAQLVLVLSLELLCQELEVSSGKIEVVGNALFFLHLVDELLKVLLANFHNDVGEHLDEAAVGVVNETLERGIGVACDHGSDDFVVQTEVKDGVHHAGHGCTCTGADRDQQRIVEVAELLAVDFFHLADELHDLSHDVVIDLAAIFVVLGASFGGDGETLGNGQTDLAHLCQVCALTAEKVTHGGIAFGEHVNELLAHV